MSVKEQRLIKGAKEEAALARAENLLTQGDQAFGNPDEKFDLNKDMEDLTIAGVMKSGDSDKVKEELKQQGGESTEPAADDSSTESTGFSDDPEERFVQIHDFLKGFRKDAPSVARLKEWKSMHGRVFIVNVDDYVFVYRFLKRQEYRQINAQGSLENMREDEVEDSMFDRCVLWPTFDVAAKAMLPAGAIPMVVSQVQIQSLFLDPAAVAQATIKL